MRVLELRAGVTTNTTHFVMSSLEKSSREARAEVANELFYQLKRELLPIIAQELEFIEDIATMQTQARVTIRVLSQP